MAVLALNVSVKKIEELERMLKIQLSSECSQLRYTCDIQGGFFHRAFPKIQFMSDSVQNSLIIDFRGGPVWHLENFVILGEAQSVYFNFLARTRGGPVGIL